MVLLVLHTQFLILVKAKCRFRSEFWVVMCTVVCFFVLLSQTASPALISVSRYLKETKSNPNALEDSCVNGSLLMAGERVRSKGKWQTFLPPLNVVKRWHIAYVSY